MVPAPPVLAQIVQNEPWWAKLALEKLGPIWLLGSIWLFSFYSVINPVSDNQERCSPLGLRGFACMGVSSLS